MYNVFTNSNKNNTVMNVKALIPIVVGVLIATVAYNMFLKKIVEKESYELEDYDSN